MTRFDTSIRLQVFVLVFAALVAIPAAADEAGSVQSESRVEKTFGDGRFYAESDIVTIHWFPDGTRLLTLLAKTDDSNAAYPGICQIWSVDSGQPIETFPAPEPSTVREIWISLNGQRVSFLSGGVLHVRDLKNRTYSRPLEFNSGLPLPVWSVNGKYAAGVNKEQKVEVWSLDDHRLLQTISFESKVHQLGLSTDGLKLVTCHLDNKTRVWDVNSNELAAVHASETAGVRAAISPNAAFVARGNIPDRKISFFRTLPELQHSESHFDTTLNSSRILLLSTFSRDSRYLRWPVWQGGVAIHDFQLNKTFRYPEVLSRETSRLEYDIHRHDEFVEAVGPRILISKLTENGRKPVAAADAPITRAELSSDNRYLVSHRQDGTTRIWDAETAEMIVALDIPGTGKFALNGSTFMYFDGERAIKQFDLKKKIETGSFDLFPDDDEEEYRISSDECKFMGNGRWFAALLNERDTGTQLALIEIAENGNKLVSQFRFDLPRFRRRRSRQVHQVQLAMTEPASRTVRVAMHFGDLRLDVLEVRNGEIRLQETFDLPYYCNHIDAKIYLVADQRHILADFECGVVLFRPDTKDGDLLRLTAQGSVRAFSSDGLYLFHALPGGELRTYDVLSKQIVQVSRLPESTGSGQLKLASISHDHTQAVAIDSRNRVITWKIPEPVDDSGAAEEPVDAKITTVVENDAIDAYRAVTSLARNDGAKAVEPLKSAFIKIPDDFLGRLRIVHALERIGGEEAAKALMELYEFADPPWRSITYGALRRTQREADNHDKPRD